MLEGTLLENICLGINKKQIDYKKLKEAIEMAQLNKLIDSSEKGIHMYIGERGDLLSGGQVQRIAIARAMYADANFVIMEEPTSSLDENTSHMIFKLISNMKEKKTFLIVSHWSSSTIYADNCIEI